jgi:TolB-like protein
MNRPTLTAIAAFALFAAGSRLAAQSEAPLPTITVTPFTADRLTEETRSLGEESADDLAERLVASGRYRVLARDWMPLPAKGRSGSYPVATIRQAAARAGVQYIVFGSMRAYVVRVVSSPAVGYLPVQKGLIFSRIIQSQTRTRRPPIKSVTRYSVDIELIDAATGELVRTMRGRGENGLPSAMGDVASTLAHLSSQLGHDKH